MHRKCYFIWIFGLEFEIRNLIHFLFSNDLKIFGSLNSQEPLQIALNFPPITNIISAYCRKG